MTRPFLATAIAAAASMTLPPAASAACEPFVAYAPSEQRDAHYADFGDEGPSVGDKLVGRRGINDADGNPLGVLYWFSEVHAVDAEGKANSQTLDSVAVLDDGVIFGSVSPTHPVDVARVPEKVGSGFPSSGMITYDIVGGMDAYADVRGTIAVEADGDSGDLAYHFDVTCE
jgi:hypothetical protein